MFSLLNVPFLVRTIFPLRGEDVGFPWTVTVSDPSDSASKEGGRHGE